MDQPLRPRPAQDAVPWSLVAWAAAAAAIAAIVDFASFALPAIVGAAYVALSVGFTVAVSHRRRDLRKSPYPLISIPFIVLLVGDGFIILFPSAIAARFGMGALYISFWVSVCIVVARGVERWSRGHRGSPGSHTGEVVLTLLAAIGGLAVPFVGLTSVTSPHVETSSIYLTNCHGGTSLPNGALLTVSYDGGRPQVVSYDAGKAHYDAPEYFANAAVKLEYGPGGSTPPLPFRMGGPDAFLYLAGRVGSMGFVPPTRGLSDFRMDVCAGRSPSGAA